VVKNINLILVGVKSVNLVVVVVVNKFELVVGLSSALRWYLSYFGAL